MKIKKNISTLCVLSGLCVSTFAQTNPPPAASFSDGLKVMANALTSETNWTAIAGYGHSTKGANNLVFIDLAYNINENVGIVLGYDYLFSGSQGEANVVKGGLSLQTSIRPFAFLGTSFATNIVAQPFVADLLATPKNSGAGIGNIITTGVNFDVYSFKNFELNAGGQYENRTGQGNWDGSYLLFHLGITRKF